jgi:hypothetical protein
MEVIMLDIDYDCRAKKIEKDGRIVSICPNCGSILEETAEYIDGTTDYICTAYYRCTCGLIVREDV